MLRIMKNQYPTAHPVAHLKLVGTLSVQIAIGMASTVLSIVTISNPRTIHALILKTMNNRKSGVDAFIYIIRVYRASLLTYHYSLWKECALCYFAKQKFMVQ